MVGAERSGITTLKKSLHARERDTAEAQQRRQAWWEQIQSLDPARLVFVDESGVTTQMTRHYGRAPGGERVGETTSQSHWRTLTVLGAITQKGVLASMTIQDATDGEVFLAYVEQVLSPQLEVGPFVIMDNLGAHKVEGVREKIEARGQD